MTFLSIQILNSVEFGLKNLLGKMKNISFENRANKSLSKNLIIFSFQTKL